MKVVQWLSAVPVVFLVSCLSPDQGQIAEPKLFKALAAGHTGVHFNNRLTETEDFNIIQYLYYYNGGGVAAGDINNDGLPDLYFCANQLPNKLYLNKGDFQFEDITEKAGVAGNGGWSTGVTTADVNGDGRLDIYVCQVAGYKQLKGRNLLFINKGDGTFEESAADYGLDFRGLSTQAAFFDYDGDGDLDMYLLNHSVHSAENYGNSNLRDNRDSLAGDRLFQNLDGKFRDVSRQAGIYSSKIGYGLGVAVGDLNDDGCPDIYVSNDFHENDYLYYNNCDGTFREGLRASMGHCSAFSMGSDMADVNNDGRLDLLSTDMKPEVESILKSSVGADPYNIYRFKLGFGYYFQYPRNMLQLNRGNLLGGNTVQFSEIGQLAGFAATDWSWSPMIADLDNDGLKDIFVSNGIWRRPNDLDYLKYISSGQIQKEASDLELAQQMPSGLVKNYCFRNEGGLHFRNVSGQWGLDLVGSSNGTVFTDLNNDGRLDLVLNNLNQEASIFQNVGSKNHYLKIQLKDRSPNTYGIGARVRLRAGDQLLVQENFVTRGFQSAVEPVLHFGLGPAASVDFVEVRWPDGLAERFSGIRPDRLLTLEKGTGTAIIQKAAESLPPLFSDITSESGIHFYHRENDFNDFDREKLLPHMLSTEGPCLAVADVDQDGLEDLYVGGATGQSGELYLQQPSGDFSLAPQNAFIMDRAREDADAIFFDADGDGDEDLFVVSGGGEWDLEVEALKDRLYLNNGRGAFSRSEDSLPELYANGSCVVVLDYNKDGAPDLFVGSRSYPGAYGLPPRSFLLKNKGRGQFEEVSASAAPMLSELGMVTDAALTDDGLLIVVGEWMPVTLFQPGPRKWKKKEIPYSHGWWNAVLPLDMDQDGDTDLLLGNLGLNSDLKASREEPIELFVNDYDDNGATDPILTYYKQGKRYTYHSLDELFAQLVVLRKSFPDYASFARSPLEDIFRKRALEGSIHHRAYTLASAWAENLGMGRYELHELPGEAQFAPIRSFLSGDFNGDDRIDVLAVGNFLLTQPAFGRYDASYGIHLQIGETGQLEVVDPLNSGFVAPGEGRDIEMIKSDGRPMILVARNNERLRVFRPGKMKKVVN